MYRLSEQLFPVSVGVLCGFSSILVILAGGDWPHQLGAAAIVFTAVIIGNKNGRWRANRDRKEQEQNLDD